MAPLITPTTDVNNVDHTYKQGNDTYGLNAAGTAFELKTPPTVPTAVPTKAPVPVVSGSTASNFINEKIVPAMNTAQQSIADLQAQKKLTTIDKKSNADGTSDLYMSDGSRVKTDANGNIMGNKTPEQQIADTPDAGYKFIYNPNDGTRTQIPLNETAAQYGMLDNNPTVAPNKPVLGSAELPSGTSIKQYNDGSYGLFDVSGKYIGNASQTQFQNAQNGQAVLDKLNSAVNGNYPLTSNQQAQIDSIKAQYQRLITQQEKANANFTGGTTVAQNLYGIGNTQMGVGEIKGVIDAGIDKVTDIQTRMNSDVAKMTQAFQEGNLQDLKAAYAAFSSNSKELQNSLDKTHDDAAALIKEDAMRRATAENAVLNDINTFQAEVAKAGGAENQAAYDIALANKDYAGMVKAAGNILTGGIGGEYNIYKKDMIARGLKPLSFDAYQTADANRKAKIAAAGATRMGGTTGLTKDELKVINGVNSVITSSPVYKTVQSANAFVDGVKASLAEGTGLGDIAAINQFQKVIDEGAVTRDQDVKLVIGAQTVMDRLKTWARKNATTGDVMDDKLRGEMNSVMQSLLKVKVERLKNSPEIASQLRIASKTGISPEDTIIGAITSPVVTVGEEHKQEAINKKIGLLDWSKADTKNTAMMNSLRTAFPNASPEEIYDKLKAKGYIK